MGVAVGVAADVVVGAAVGVAVNVAESHVRWEGVEPYRDRATRACCSVAQCVACGLVPLLQQLLPLLLLLLLLLLLTKR